MSAVQPRKNIVILSFFSKLHPGNNEVPGFLKKLPNSKYNYAKSNDIYKGCYCYLILDVEYLSSILWFNLAWGTMTHPKSKAEINLHYKSQPNEA